MARPAGSRNSGYDERRNAIAARLLTRLAQPEGAKSSLRELAQAAGVSVSTIRHYFGDRNGAVAAALNQVRMMGRPWIEIAANQHVHAPLEESLVWFLEMFVEGWDNGVGPMIAESLAAATGVPMLGQAAVTDVLEPLLQGIEARLAHHQLRGELPEGVDLRAAALSLLSPLMLALLHQRSWHGHACRPLDVKAYIAEHVRRFARGWGADIGAAEPRVEA